jgi:hypothetical protein
MAVAQGDSLVRSDLARVHSCLIHYPSGGLSGGFSAPLIGYTGAGSRREVQRLSSRRLLPRCTPPVGFLTFTMGGKRENLRLAALLASASVEVEIGGHQFPSGF